MNEPEAVFTLKEEDVVYLDNHLLVVNKPPGVVVQTDKMGNQALEDAARDFLKAKFQKPGNVFATATHRLDRPVGGLVVIARTSKALVRMNAMFQSREIKKIYLALVEGKPAVHKWLRNWIKRNDVTNKVWTYTYPRGDAKQADLAYWHLSGIQDKSMLMVRLFSGRHHQIRAQLALDKTPILGDVKYGSKNPIGQDICLFSYALEFVHPVSKETIRLVAAMPSSGLWSSHSEPSENQLNEAFDLPFKS